MSVAPRSAPGSAAQSAQTVPLRPPVNKWLVTLSVTFGTLMGAIDTSIVAVATPHLRGALDSTVEEMTWVTTGFVIATVVVMPLTAFLGRLFGQKRVYLFSLVLFVIGSALCGLARSLPMMVAFRALQGLGAGALQPTEQAILRQTFPPEEQGMAMALFGLAVVVGPAVGPTLGGYIIDNYSWPWIFFINLPVGVLALFMVTRFVHEPEDIRRANVEAARRQRGNIDWIGIGLMAIGLATLQYVLEEGSRNDWFDSRAIVVCTVIAAFVLAAFVIRELTAEFPAVDLRLFKDSDLPVGHADRRDDVRDPDVDHLPAAGLHAGAARLHRDAVGRGVDAARAGDDGRHPDRRAPLQQGAAAHPGADRHLAGGAQHVHDVALHARHRRAHGGVRDRRPGPRLRVAVRAADRGRAEHDSALPARRRHRPQLAAAADRRLAGPGRVRDAAPAFHRRRAQRAGSAPAGRPTRGDGSLQHDRARPARAGL